MPKINRREPDEENFLILRQLASKREQTRTDFEEPPRKIKGIKDELDLGKNRSRYIPHSSLILRLKKLVESRAIIEQNSGKTSKKGLPIMKYSLTFFGFIKLLQLCEREEFHNDIFENASVYIPKIIWFQIEQLLEHEMMSKEHLFFILVEVAKNTDIQIDLDPKDHAGTIGNRVYRFPSSLLAKEIRWIHIHDIEIKIKQIQNVYSLHRTFITYGKARSKKDMQEKNSKTLGDINKMFIFAFTHELIMRCYRTDDRFSKSDGNMKYPTYDEAPYLLEFLKLNESLKNIYLTNIDYILDQQRIEQETMTNVTKILKTKKSLISRKKNEKLGRNTV